MSRISLFRLFCAINSGNINCILQSIVVRPLDIVIGRLRFYHDSSFYIRQLPSELPECNSTKTGHMLKSECDLKMHVRNLGYPLPYKSEAQKPPFSTTSQLNGKFNRLGKRVGSHNRSPTSRQNVELWSTNGL